MESKTANRGKLLYILKLPQFSGIRTIMNTIAVCLGNKEKLVINTAFEY